MSCRYFKEIYFGVYFDPKLVSSVNIAVFLTQFILMNCRTNEKRERERVSMWGRELSKVRKTAGQLKHEQHEGTALDTGNAQVCVCTKKEYQFQNIIVLFLLEIKNYFSFNIMYIYIFEYIMRTNYLDQILCDFYLSNNFFFLLDFSFLVVSIFFCIRLSMYTKVY